jgi:putative ABC transport system substrate-binding protein
MKRREFITLLGGAAAWPLAARGQQSERIRRIGVLGSTPPGAAAGALSAFRDALRERGYVDGQNVAIDYRWPEQSFEQNPNVATDLVRNRVDIIVAWASPAVAAARRATSTIPIVMVGAGDPIGTGFIASLARPGGNVTGVSDISRDLSSKIVQLLIDIVPNMSRVGVVYEPDNPTMPSMRRETEDAIRALGREVRFFEAAASAEFEKAFGRFSNEGITGVLVLPGPSAIVWRTKLAELAQTVRQPTAFRRRENVETGGLLSCGPSLNDEFRRAAYYVDRILKGTKPAELPVELPTKFNLVINLKTAKTLGLSVPPTMLALADEVIE